jgi:hypothetical protein
MPARGQTRSLSTCNRLYAIRSRASKPLVRASYDRHEMKSVVACSGVQVTTDFTISMIHTFAGVNQTPTTHTTFVSHTQLSFYGNYLLTAVPWVDAFLGGEPTHGFG